MTDPVLQAAVEGESPWLFGAVEITFPDYTLRLLDGAGQVEIAGNLYVGEDPTFGVLDSISAMDEQIGEEAPTITLGLLPPDGAASATLAHASMQGSQVKVMLGAWDPVSGNAIGTPELLFLGELDVPTIEIDEQGGRQLSYTVVSVYERLFEVDEGQRASNGWHQSIWPGELGLEYMTGTARKLFLGAKRPVGYNIGSGGSGQGGGARIPPVIQPVDLTGTY